MANKNEFVFFILVVVLSIPFWLLGYFIDLSNLILVNLPISALMIFCPAVASIILIRREKKSPGVLIKRVFDLKRVSNPFWYIPALFLISALMVLTFFIMKWLGVSLPKFELNPGDAIFLIILFFAGAVAEEIGWTGYLTDRLGKNFGYLKAALIIGSFWAIWHIIPYLEAHRTAGWIFWQCIGTVALRVIIVWLYANSGQSLFITIICHTSLNLSEFYFPNYGSHYDPFYFGIVLIFAAIIIGFFGFKENYPLKVNENNT